jgi:acetolactate synthase-1/3 small subunit
MIKDTGNEINESGQYVLKLTVNNHPGVMSHVCGLFARRCYNLEGVMVRSIKGESGKCGERDKRSLMWLLLNEDGKSEQVIKQTEKLLDVIQIERVTPGESVFRETRL